MKVRWVKSAVCIAMFIASPMFAQQTIARLNHELEMDRTHVSAESHLPRRTTQSAKPEKPLIETPLSRGAARALFVQSDLRGSRSLAARALRQNPSDAEALFVQMEAAALQADDAAMLDSAVRLCELAGGPQPDARVLLAAVRLREAAANTREFRKQIPRIQAVLANSQGNWPDLHAALLAAAMDGAPGLEARVVSRAAGILTEWRIVGPLGQQAVTDLGGVRAPESDSLSRANYAGHAAEDFQFSDGVVRLPEYLARRGAFYATSSFASLTSGAWQLQAETAGMLTVMIDGRLVLRQDPLTQHGTATLTETIDLSPGPHRVRVTCTGPAAAFRIRVTPEIAEASALVRNHVSTQELAYELAAQDYAEGDNQAVVEQFQAMPSSMTSAAWVFLLAQAETHDHLVMTKMEGAAGWRKLLRLAPGALAADVALARVAAASKDYAQATVYARRVLALHPSNDAALEVLTDVFAKASIQAGVSRVQVDQAWAERLSEHPSCEAGQAAVAYYGARGEMERAASAQRALEDCAPESLAYAKSLAEQGRHGESAQALRKLLSNSPLNRSARLMLVRELQLAGQDLEAQQAAVEWLHIAPNAESYRRMGARQEAAATGDPSTASVQEPFYASYRRDVLPLARESSDERGRDATLLLDDHVAVARPDGSVSLYVHRTTRVLSEAAAVQYAQGTLPEDAQLLQAHVVRGDGGVNEARPETGGRSLGFGALLPGDTIDEEYVVNYTGDGGIAEHSEAFQFVFGSFEMPIVRARFVVLTIAEQADQGVVIATGDAPKMTKGLDNGMLARVWEKDAGTTTANASAADSSGLPIVRVVEQENGWTVPRNAERQRRIETIHPGPRFEES